MAATGNEAVKLSQLKQALSGVSGGGLLRRYLSGRIDIFVDG